MKKLLILSLCLFLPAQALAVKAVWDSVLDADGYKLYLGRISGSYEQIIDCGTSTEWPLIDASYLYVTVTAYNSYGESDYATEINWRNHLISICDLNGDGVIDYADFEIFRSVFLRTVP